MSTPKRQLDYDVDDVAVELACYGDRTVTLNPVEMGECFRILNERGLSLVKIAEVLGVSDRTVCRWRAGVAYFHWRRPTGLRAESRGLVNQEGRVSPDPVSLGRAS